MKKPTVFVVGPHLWTITYDANRAAEHSARAVTLPETQEVFVDTDLTESGLRESLLHEVLHAVWETSALRAIEDGAHTKEVAITALATGLLDTLQRSHQLRKFILGVGDA